MSKRRRAERKTQKRAEIAKSRVLSRRKKLRADAKKLNDSAKQAEHFRPRIFPIRKNKNEVPAMTQQMQFDDIRKKEWLKKKIEHNMQILDALEKEMLAEDEARDNLNASLEAENANTLREKMDLLAEKAQETFGSELTE